MLSKLTLAWLPLEMYPRPKKQRPILKETKDFISNNEMRTYLNNEIRI